MLKTIQILAVLATVLLCIAGPIGYLAFQLSPAFRSQCLFATSFRGDPSLAAAAALAKSCPGQARSLEAEKIAFSQATGEAHWREYLRLFPQGQVRDQALTELLQAALKAEDQMAILQVAKLSSDSAVGKQARQELLKRSEVVLSREFLLTLEGLESNELRVLVKARGKGHDKWSDQYPPIVFTAIESQLKFALDGVGVQVVQATSESEADLLVEIDVSESSERYSSNGSPMGAVSRQIAEAVITLRQAKDELEILTMGVETPSEFSGQSLYGVAHGDASSATAKALSSRLVSKLKGL